VTDDERIAVITKRLEADALDATSSILNKEFQ